MRKKFSIVQWLAFFFAAVFIGIVLISHWPGLTDEQGRLLGLFYIDPIDDIFHFLSGLIALLVGLKSYRASIIYFWIAGIPYGIDAATGLFFSREFLNGNLFVHGFGGPNFSLDNFLVNLPHILILIVMLFIAYWFGGRSIERTA